MNERIEISVSCDSFGTHTHQLFCGLHMLRRFGMARLSYCLPPGWLKKNRYTRQLVYLSVRFFDRFESHIFDFNDSSTLACTEALNYCKYCHKRSYDPFHYGSLEAKTNCKVLPLGFNYQINAESYMDAVVRSIMELLIYRYNPVANNNMPHLKNILTYYRDLIMRWRNNKHFLNRFEISSTPHFYGRNNVLFQCRLWNPKDFPEQHRDSISMLNSIRVETIRKLSSHFGPKFTGGIQYSEFSMKYARDLVIMSKTNRKSYIELVRNSSVVVTTNGISDSVGWKMGEFVAASKAIVCEPLKHKVPGPFEVQTHYLSYNTPDKCLEECDRLLYDDKLNALLSENCFSYYNRYLRPDMLVLNSIFPNSKIERSVPI